MDSLAKVTVDEKDAKVTVETVAFLPDPEKIKEGANSTKDWYYFGEDQWNSVASLTHLQKILTFRLNELSMRAVGV